MQEAIPARQPSGSSVRVLLEGQGENTSLPQGRLLWRLQMHLAVLQMILVIAILLGYLLFTFFSPSAPVASEKNGCAVR